MGKIEDCFGTREEAQLYGLTAFEQPILRLSFEPVDFGDVGSDIAHEHVHMRALAGIVVSPDVVEPEHADIVHPAIRIQPVSSASVQVARNPNRIRQDTGYAVSTLDESHSLLIQRPLNDPELFKPVIQEMVSKAKGALTVCRVLPIREVIQELSRQRDVKVHGRILHDLAKIAVNNIW